MIDCEWCGEEFDPDDSEALDNDKYCTPECEGNADEELDEYYEDWEDEDYE